MSAGRGPLVVEVTRGERVESRHEVDAVVVTADGSVVDAWGDPGTWVMPGSAVKPIQAIPLVAGGSADAFDLSDVELALACASHGGEPDHVAAVTRWLERIGASPADLACGAHRPLHDHAAMSLGPGVEPTAVHNNCSGKHAGFLTLCLHHGLPIDGYTEPAHRLQSGYVTPVVGEWCGVDLSGQTPVVDGCGIPVWALPLERLATGWARLGAGQEGSPEFRLLEAMRSEPFYVAGTDRACTRLISAGSRRLVVKTGAEGVFCATLPDDGLGLALKVRDGAGRASDAAVTWLLQRLGGLPDLPDAVLTNRAGAVVGVVRVRG